MTDYREQDIPSMLVEFGLPIVLGGVTTFGLVDPSDQEILAGSGTHGMARHIAVRVKTGSLPALLPAVPVLVDGESLIVRSVQQLAHGLTQFTCAKEGI